MAVPARFVTAGMLLALTLAAVPLVIPVDFAGADSTKPALSPPPIPALLHLVTLPLAPPAESSDLAPLTPQDSGPGVTASGEALGGISGEVSLRTNPSAEEDPSSVAALLQSGDLLAERVRDALTPETEVTATHTVTYGETLWGISQGAGVSMQALAAVNGISLEAALHPGQVLVVPSPGTSVPAAPASNPPTARGPGLSFRGTPIVASVSVAAAKQSPMVQPSPGTITSRFGWRIHPIFGTREFHTGLDIAARLGTPVRAARSGMVRFVGWMAGYGRLIVVDHGNGLETSYSHLSSALVGLGQRVAMGEILGRIGNTGWSTGPHLLFEVRWNGVPIDPSRFLP